MDKPLFTMMGNKHTGIDFVNRLEYTEEFNTYTYRNFYNGAGVGMADFNRDGLTDLYFCSNMTGNKLYINKGDFVFEDVTDPAGVSCIDSWSTGVSIADVNGDGLPDIYVCKSGNPKGTHRYNELFINNGNLTFSEKAKEYGLAEVGLSNHASFFDYDRDGDLDCYLLNNSLQSVTEFEIIPGQRQIRDTLGGNKLFRNEGDHFVDISEQAGIYGSKIGFGLGVSAGDLNRDGWPDIYISNDFFERDYLYINNRNGTFTEALEDQMREISQGAMGADIADINNDAWPDLFATEMTPEGNDRLKTKAVFDTWETYQKKVNNGYYHQFARNVLQLNNQNGSFSEIGRLAGVSTTDWSWGALIMDMDNDGWKDIFVANGIYKDLLDRDYLDFYSNPALMRSMIRTQEKAILKMIDMIPSVSIPNYAFHNNGDLTFDNLSMSWGLATPSFSNGAAYGDLDNDGDLDLVVNNVNMPPFVYRNETNSKGKANFLVLSLRGTGKNTGAIGAEVTLYVQGKINYQELFPMRGFESTVDERLHFGLGESTVVDSLLINWPNGSFTKMFKIAANQFLTIDQKESNPAEETIEIKDGAELFGKKIQPAGLDYFHKENVFVDFERDRLLPGMLSNEGPHLAVADVNGDRLDDLFICGAKDSPGALFVQDRQGHFKKTNENLFEKDKVSEDTDCAFFDADGDGDQDLYVASGGNEFPSSSSALSDRLYLNDGRGDFTKGSQVLPAGKYESTSCVVPSDFDRDSDIDLFVGIRLQPFSYGLPANGYLLENDGHGHFTDVTKQRAPALSNIGMITDMVWADVDQDGDDDMVIAGDWMPVKLLLNTSGNFSDASEQYGLANTEGWWHTLVAKDLDNDGDIDFVVGNHGLNSRFKAMPDKPVEMYVNDFDLNGNIEQIICAYNGEKSWPVALRDDLLKQIPSLASKYKKYADYASQSIEDMFSPDILKRSVRLNARILQSSIMINTGKGGFDVIPLPVEAQYSPVYAIFADDMDQDGICDILLGGNQYRSKPELGIYDASYGLFLKGISPAAWKPVGPANSGIFIKGEIRDFRKMNINGRRVIAVAKNNDNLQLYNIDRKP